MLVINVKTFNVPTVRNSVIRKMCTETIPNSQIIAPKSMKRKLSHVINSIIQREENTEGEDQQKESL